MSKKVIFFDVGFIASSYGEDSDNDERDSGNTELINVCMRIRCLEGLTGRNLQHIIKIFDEYVHISKFRELYFLYIRIESFINQIYTKGDEVDLIHLEKTAKYLKDDNIDFP